MSVFTKEKLAERYSVTQRTIESWVAHGAIPAPVHVGRRCYWHEAALAQWETRLFGLANTPTQPTKVRQGRRRAVPTKD